LDGPGLCELMHGLCELMHGLGQPMLVLGQLLLVLGQLLVPRRKRTCRQSRQLIPDLGQLILGLGQLILEQAVLLRQVHGQRGRKLELADGGSGRDLRQGRRSVIGRTFKKDVGDRGLRGAGEEEEATVESGEPQPGGPARPSQPRG
jgi:hypothetical protein